MRERERESCAHNISIYIGEWLCIAVLFSECCFGRLCHYWI